jgi:hypothetical protein
MNCGDLYLRGSGSALGWAFLVGILLGGAFTSYGALRVLLDVKARPPRFQDLAKTDAGDAVFFVVSAALVLSVGIFVMYAMGCNLYVNMRSMF